MLRPKYFERALSSEQKVYIEKEEVFTSVIDQKSHLKFFIERSAETLEKTMTLMHQLQTEVATLKSELVKAENELKNLALHSQEEESKRA